MEKSVFWHQGLFLQPQHLQLLSRYSESQNLVVKEFLAPYVWGVGSCRIQPAALDNRSVQLAEGRFLFPDLAYTVLSENALVNPRSFEEAWEEGGSHFDVYLGLRKFNPSGMNVTVVDNLSDIADVNTRWVTTGQADLVPDLHQDGPAAEVQRLYYVLKIFWGSERAQLGSYEFLHLARLVRDQDKIRLSTGFVPPCLTIGSDATLYNILKEIRDQIGARSRQLEGYKRDRGLHSAEFGARDMVYLLALRSLNRYAPMLAHLMAARSGHPWAVYGRLRQLIGELSTFAADVSYTGEDAGGTQLLPEYDHGDIGGCFSAARTLVTRLLDQITAGPEYVLPLMFDGTYFGTELPPAIFEGRNRFYLIMETESDPQPLLNAMQGIAKLGCRESLPILIARSLSGIGMAHLTEIPQELPRRSRALYFRIDHHNDQWGQVQRGKNVALYWDAAPEDLKIELMAVGRS